MSTVIKIEQLSKYYRLGLIGGATLREDVSRWTARLSGKPDPLAPLDDASGPKRGSGELWALRNIDLEINEGEILGVVGRNGAGKSTLLKILSKITAPTSGRVKIKGRIGSLLEVGTGFHPELTGLENIYLNGTILGMSRREISAKLDAIVSFSGINEFIDTPVKRYSSGMKVRLAFSVAAHLEPEILIVDEVLAVGDAAFQKKCLGKMNEVASHGRTILFVSHNMSAIRSLCSSAIYLDAGHIKTQGAVNDVVNSYLEENLSIETSRMRQWPDKKHAPGNERAKVRSVKVFNENFEQEQFVLSDRNISIEIDYWLAEDLENIDLTLVFKSTDGQVVFNTSTVHAGASVEQSGRNGNYRATCTIPAFLLNNEVYKVKLLVLQERSRVVFAMDDLVVFELTDTQTNRSGYMGKRPGLIAPMLDWRNQRLA